MLMGQLHQLDVYLVRKGVRHSDMRGLEFCVCIYGWMGPHLTVIAYAVCARRNQQVKYLLLLYGVAHQ